MLKEITTVIQKFLQFLKSPKDRFAEPVTSNDRYRIFTVLFFAAMLLNLLVIIPLLWMVDEYVMKFTDSSMSRHTIWFLLFLTVIFAPLWEEFVFRFPLKTERNYLVRWADKLVGKPVFSNFWNRHFAVIFYLIALLFGFAHSFKSGNVWTPLYLLLLPLLILSQSIAGLILGYIRLRLGFLWAVLFHACFNFVVISVPYLSYQHTEIISHKTPDYELKVIGLFCRDSSNTYFTYDKREGKIFMVQGTNIDLQFFLNSFLDKEYKVMDGELVHLYFKSKKGLTEQELIKLLKEEFEITEQQ